MIWFLIAIMILIIHEGFVHKNEDHLCSCNTYAETANPGRAGRVVGEFKSRKTGDTIVALAKKGETNQEALTRVMKRHGY